MLVSLPISHLVDLSGFEVYTGILVGPASQLSPPFTFLPPTFVLAISEHLFYSHKLKSFIQSQPLYGISLLHQKIKTQKITKLLGYNLTYNINKCIYYTFII